MTTHTHVCPALNPWDPLGFLASLGMLRVLDDAARDEGVRRPRLRFADDASPYAIVECGWTLDEVVDRILRDAQRQSDNPVLNIEHDKAGRRCATGTGTRDLKPTPEYARETLIECAIGQRSFADQAAGLFSELVQDNNSRTKPTALHFTAGQQSFLDMAYRLRTALTAQQIRAALLAWDDIDTEAPSFAWEGSGARMYALRANSPSGDKKGAVPGPNWLGVRGLSMVPVRVRKDELVTAGVRGQWKTARFAWPVWTRFATAPTTVALLRSDLRELRALERSALGITLVLEATMPRTDQGGYGSFAPPTVLAPRKSS
jgi:hypothetical protein